MSTASKPALLSKLAGKKILFAGKYEKFDLEDFQAFVLALKGTIVEELNVRVDYLMLSGAGSAVDLQKAARALNKKGASIQIMQMDGFLWDIKPTDQEMIDLIQHGKSAAVPFDLFSRKFFNDASSNPEAFSLQTQGQKYDGITMGEFNLYNVKLDRCSFAGVQMPNATLRGPVACDFRKAELSRVGTDDNHLTRIWDARKCQFNDATMTAAWVLGNVEGSDFSGAKLMKARLSGDNPHGKDRKKRGSKAHPGQAGVRYGKADLRGAQIETMALAAPDFQDADLRGAHISDCNLENANFRGANLQGTTFVRCAINKADFSSATLRATSFGDTDLSESIMKNADMADCRFYGATLRGINFSGAKNYDAGKSAGGKVGPAMKLLDGIVRKAKRVQVTFMVPSGDDGAREKIGIDSKHMSVSLPKIANSSYFNGDQWLNRDGAFSEALRELVVLTGVRPVFFETLEVDAVKSPLPGKDLRTAVMNAIAEAFGQPVLVEGLESATKAQREETRRTKEAHAAAKATAAKAQANSEEAARKKTEKKIAKAVGGKVKDLPGFLTALQLRIEAPKIQKATQMLKASGFELYNDVTADFMSGVVKSQTDPGLVYACRMKSDGSYSCCTQNLNVCGGLRGSICKHLLVLIIGLVQAEKLDPNTIDGWVAKSNTTKPVLDKEIMGEIFIRYKGAEAGEVDWRPTETMPEDYYAL